MLKNTNTIVQNIKKKYSKDKIPQLNIGDTIKLGVLIQEGHKERIQVTDGVIISLHSKDLNSTITVRKIFQGIGIEKVYLLHSPRITSIEIIKRSKIRKAKLYYLRGRTGKATRLKQKYIL